MKTKTYANSNVNVWTSSGREIFPSLEKTIPAGSIVKRRNSEEFVTLEHECKWIKLVKKQSDCTGMSNWIEYTWDIETV